MIETFGYNPYVHVEQPKDKYDTNITDEKHMASVHLFVVEQLVNHSIVVGARKLVGEKDTDDHNGGEVDGRDKYRNDDMDKEY